MVNHVRIAFWSTSQCVGQWKPSCRARLHRATILSRVSEWVSGIHSGNGCVHAFTIQMWKTSVIEQHRVMYRDVARYATINTRRWQHNTPRWKCCERRGTPVLNAAARHDTFCRSPTCTTHGAPGAFSHFALLAPRSWISTFLALYGKRRRGGVSSSLGLDEGGLISVVSRHVSSVCWFGWAETSWSWRREAPLGGVLSLRPSNGPGILKGRVAATLFNERYVRSIFPRRTVSRWLGRVFLGQIWQEKHKLQISCCI